MIILKEKVAAYNNTLTLATKEMKFGMNEEVNKTEGPQEPEASKAPTQKDNNPVPQTESDETILPQPTQKIPSVISKTDDETTYLLASAITLGFVFAKYVI